jgi:hypothetical protein
MLFQYGLAELVLLYKRHCPHASPFSGQVNTANSREKTQVLHFASLFAGCDGDLGQSGDWITFPSLEVAFHSTLPNWASIWRLNSLQVMSVDEEHESKNAITCPYWSYFFSEWLG